jgi:lysophospholipase L1-like esterase
MNLLVNNAWSGDNVASSRFENGCVNLHDNTGNASDINPDIIFCYIGINNHSAGTTVEEFKAAYDKVIKLMKEKYAGADIFIFTLPQHYGVNNEAKVALLDSYNAAIRELAASNGCYVVDLAAESGITRANSINYTTDNLHPNLMGMDVITKVVIEELMEKYLA